GRGGRHCGGPQGVGDTRGRIGRAVGGGAGRSAVRSRCNESGGRPGGLAANASTAFATPAGRCRGGLAAARRIARAAGGGGSGGGVLSEEAASVPGRAATRGTHRILPRRQACRRCSGAALRSSTRRS